MKTKTIQFTHKKDTENKRVYSEVPVPGEAPIIGALYVGKWFVEGATKIKVTIEVE
jgi:hypothetical protein